MNFIRMFSELIFSHNFLIIFEYQISWCFFFVYWSWRVLRSIIVWWNRYGASLLSFRTVRFCLYSQQMYPLRQLQCLGDLIILRLIMIHWCCLPWDLVLKTILLLPSKWLDNKLVCRILKIYWRSSRLFQKSLGR